MARSQNTPEPKRARRPPATTVEARENQMIALAIDLAEQQMREGTASSQVITHYLKLGTTRERLEQKKIQLENTLIEAKADQIASGKRVEELYDSAIKAMRTYSGQDVEMDTE